MNILDAHELLDDIERDVRTKLHVDLVLHCDPIVTDDAEASPAQISAARTLLDFNLKFTELTDVLDRLTELEQWRDETDAKH